MTWFLEQIVSPEMLRNFRLDRGMTQAELAEEMRVSPNTLARWERGERAIPRLAQSWICLYVEWEERA